MDSGENVTFLAGDILKVNIIAEDSEGAKTTNIKTMNLVDDDSAGGTPIITNPPITVDPPISPITPVDPINPIAPIAPITPNLPIVTLAQNIVNEPNVSPIAQTQDGESSNDNTNDNITGATLTPEAVSAAVTFGQLFSLLASAGNGTESSSSSEDDSGSNNDDSGSGQSQPSPSVGLGFGSPTPGTLTSPF